MTATMQALNVMLAEVQGPVGRTVHADEVREGMQVVIGPKSWTVESITSTPGDNGGTQVRAIGHDDQGNLFCFNKHSTRIVSVR